MIAALCLASSRSLSRHPRRPDVVPNIDAPACRECSRSNDSAADAVISVTHSTQTAVARRSTPRWCARRDHASSYQRTKYARGGDPTPDARSSTRQHRRAAQGPQRLSSQRATSTTGVGTPPEGRPGAPGNVSEYDTLDRSARPRRARSQQRSHRPGLAGQTFMTATMFAPSRAERAWVTVYRSEFSGMKPKSCQRLENLASLSRRRNTTATLLFRAQVHQGTRSSPIPRSRSIRALPAPRPDRRRRELPGRSHGKAATPSRRFAFRAGRNFTSAARARGNADARDRQHD